MLKRLIVRGNQLHAGEAVVDCTVGRSGITADKREGDLATPIGSFPLRWCYWRADKLKTPPDTALPLMEITGRDGWCDDASHAWYNQPVTLPFDGRHEKLWREDDVYDLVIPLGYNDGPITPGKGSAVFLHCMREDGVGTEGCIALKKADLLKLLPLLNTKTMLVVEVDTP